MIRTSDLAQLLALARLREERARLVVGTAAASLREQENSLADAQAAIDAHDAAVVADDQMFLASIRSHPFSASQLLTIQATTRHSDHCRDGLLATRSEAGKSVEDGKARLEAVRELWRQRLSRRDKLAEIETYLLGGHRTAHASCDLEAEEMSIDRVQSSC